tara:strand:- start:575 stop:745 length:171 start_codon:yes stop_codon:yes gene_type:complete
MSISPLFLLLIFKMTVATYQQLIELLDTEAETGEQMLSLIDAFVNNSVDYLTTEEV